jgi:retinol-binding protein 3
MLVQQRKSYVQLLTIFICFLFIFSSCSAQTTNSQLDEKEKQATVEKIVKLINQNYVFPDVAKKCGEHIQEKLVAGEFDEINNRNQFARKLTEELQSINNDKHMRVRVRLPEHVQQENEDPEARRKRMEERFRRNNYGFKKLEIFDGNIGYLDYRGFMPKNLGEKTAIGAMKFLANSDAVIIDLRKNGGGDPAMVQLICSYFFDEKVHLNSLYWRKGERTQEFWTLDEVDGKRMPDVPLFILTSQRTFSGAEEFCYNMQTRKRATLIGETTGGGANPGGIFNISDNFTIFIPTGRAINPVTGTNWEGVGVKPEIEIDAEGALDRALKEARKVLVK